MGDRLDKFYIISHYYTISTILTSDILVNRVYTLNIPGILRVNK